MSRPPRRADALILLATIAVAVVLVRWADREYLRVEAPAAWRRSQVVSRPDWVWPLEQPYRRLQHDWVGLCVAATLGVVGLLAIDGRTWTRRGLARPGTIAVLAILLVGGASAATFLLVPVGPRHSVGLSYDLGDVLAFRMPGTILGVWVVGWLRPHRGRPDLRERLARLVGWMWMARVGLLIGYGLLFG